MRAAFLTLSQLQERVHGRIAPLIAPIPPPLAACVALVLLAAFAYRDLLGGGMILTGDTLHAMRIFEMRRCLDDGQLPCRWVPDMGNGYGYPLFNYYPPLPYYVGDLLQQLFGMSYLRTVDLLYLIGLVGGGLGMYFLTRRLWGDLGGLVSAVAYMYAPYIALNIYLRGALTELWGFAVAPWLFWAVYELITTSRARFVPIIALFLALLLLSHDLVAVIVAPALALWAAVLLLTRGRAAWRPALLGGAAVVWGLSLAAFFILPVLRQGEEIQLDSIALTPGDEELLYTRNFVTTQDLFFQRTADYSQLLGEREDTPIQIGWFHWAAAGLSLPAALLFLYKRRWGPGLSVLMFTAFFGVGVFMMVSRSQFIWDAFEALRFLQFPWRYMGLVSLASAGLAGAWFGLLRARPPWAQLLLAAIFIALFIGSGQMFFQAHFRCTVMPDRPIDCPGSDAEYFAAENFYKIQQGSIRDYLPVSVDKVPKEPPLGPVRLVSGSAQIRDVTRGSDWLRFQVEAPESAQLEAAIFDFPEWRLRIDGQAVPHLIGFSSGLITFGVPPGVHDIELRLEDTFIRTWGDRISLVAWVALILAIPLMILAPELGRWGARFVRRKQPDS